MTEPFVAKVFELFKDGNMSFRGEFEFAIRPVNGDHICVTELYGSDLFQVIAIEHNPVRIPKSPLAKQTADYFIKVHLIDERDDED